jgi:hypothetical protein
MGGRRIRKDDVPTHGLLNVRRQENTAGRRATVEKLDPLDNWMVAWQSADRLRDRRIASERDAGKRGIGIALGRGEFGSTRRQNEQHPDQ